jgi:hypothetical protein
MRGFLAFAVTFALLFNVWHTQYKFFRRYGLNDNFTVWMTALLLFVVLFYVYPLKFVFTLFVNQFTGVPTGFVGPDGVRVAAVRREQVPLMMSIFGLGFAAVFAVFALLYHHAYRKRRALGLNELETYDTRTFIGENAVNVAIGLLSIAIALWGARYSLFSGFAYWLLAPVHFIYGSARGRRRKRLEQHLTSNAESPLNVPVG